MYRQFAPQQLTDFIDAYWIFENTSSNAMLAPILPDGCVDIIFPLRPEPGEPRIVGCMTRASFVNIAPAQRLAGIRFKPGCAKMFLEAPVHRLTDIVAPLSAFSLSIPVNLFQADEREPVDFMENTVERIIRVDRIDPRARAAINAIESSNGFCSIADVVREAAVGERQLERLFREHVGVSPKFFTRIVRLQHAHRLMREHGARNLSQIALSAGYYDQPHFNREFREIVGVNPLNEKMSYFYNTGSL